MFNGKDKSDTMVRHIVGYFVFFVIAVAISYGVSVLISNQILGYTHTFVEEYQYVSWVNFNNYVYWIVGVLQGIVMLICLYHCSDTHDDALNRKNHLWWVVGFSALNFIIGIIGAVIAQIANTWIGDNLLFPHVLFSSIEALALFLIMLIVLVFPSKDAFEW